TTLTVPPITKIILTMNSIYEDDQQFRYSWIAIVCAFSGALIGWIEFILGYIKSGWILPDILSPMVTAITWHALIGGAFGLTLAVVCTLSTMTLYGWFKSLVIVMVAWFFRHRYELPLSHGYLGVSLLFAFATALLRSPL